MWSCDIMWIFHWNTQFSCSFSSASPFKPRPGPKKAGFCDPSSKKAGMESGIPSWESVVKGCQKKRFIIMKSNVTNVEKNCTFDISIHIYIYIYNIRLHIHIHDIHVLAEYSRGQPWKCGFHEEMDLDPPKNYGVKHGKISWFFCGYKHEIAWIMSYLTSNRSVPFHQWMGWYCCGDHKWGTKGRK